MMTIHRSHRMEVLARDLCEVLRDPAAQDPFAPDWVVVHSAGMERWVAMQVAQTLGVAANLRFLFPGQLVQAAMDIVLGEDAADSWEPERLAWALLDVLPGLLPRPEFSSVAAYLGDPGLRREVSRREIVLARRLAETFDRYRVHRPDVVLSWDRGEGASDWQAETWRALRARLGPPDPAERLDRCFQAMRTASPALEGLPQRISIFGTSALPPLHLEVFQALARHRDVHLFVLAPSRAWYGDARTPAEEDRARRRAGAADRLDVRDPRMHPLLAAFGRLSRDFQNALTGCEAVEADDDEAGPGDSPGPQRTMLAWLQQDILAAELPEAPRPVPARDDSIRIHACHGPMRQVEVLRDALLALFDADRTLEPRDVLVMTPDIEAYAPLIEAVFGEGGGDAGFPPIPFQIADRTLGRENPAAQVVTRVLGLARGRLPASAVLDLLAVPLVARRFEMGPDDLARARGYVRDAGIRFGLDEDHRAEQGLPRTDETTWRFGLDRLLMGFAMSEDGGRLFSDVLPCERAAGGGGGTLARFVAFCEVLFDLVRRARDPRPPREWVAFTAEVLSRMVPRDGEGSEQAVEAHRSLHRLLPPPPDAGLVAEDPSRPLDLDAWLAVWESATTAVSGTRALFRGGVTFAGLVPFRSLPFRVIALMGLDDGAFPRQGSRLSFDLMARDRRPGDRSARDEDLQLFLEALLSARERLIITFTGLGVRDNAPVPPAVPVGQLLDALDASFTTDHGPASESVVVRHPLQPFSPRVFTREGVPAFDRRYEAAARALQGGERVEPRPRFDGAVPARGEGPVSLDDLGRFVRHPVRFLLRGLGMEVEPGEVAVEDRPPMTLEGLDRYEVGEAVAAALLRGEAPGPVLHGLRRAGRLPPGVLADIEFEVIRDLAAPLVPRVRARVSGPPREERVGLEVAGTRIEGVLRNLYPEGLAFVTFSSSFEPRLLVLWVQHLAATLAVEGYPGRAVLVSRSKAMPVASLGPIGPEPARAHLEDLVALHRLGRTVPLPLFPSTSFAFARAACGGQPDKALDAARSTWRTWNGRGDGNDPWVRHAFGDIPSPEDARAPGAPGFEELADRVFRPLLAALEV